MNQSTNSDNIRHRGWNGLRCTLPEFWDAIVSGPFHLLIEHDFHPVMEIRWEQVTDNSNKDLFEIIRRNFARTTETTITKVDLPKEFSALAQRHTLTTVSWEPSGRLNGLLWQCSSCSTIIFCNITPHPDISLAQLRPVLESVCCHPENEDLAFWSIQDFQLHIPRSFSFSDYTFAAGLSRLAFRGDGLHLQFCRLAPATERLRGNSLSQLLSTLQGDLVDEETLMNTPTLHERKNMPHTAHQLLTRLRRRNPFCWGRIWHNVEANRILAVTAESKRPIDINTVHSISSHYEIVQIPKAATANR
jgi:hypothetical protein